MLLVRTRNAVVELLNSLGLLDKRRVVNWNPGTVYFAKTVYYAGEMGRGPGTPKQGWDTLKKEYCSWALVMPRKRLQALYHNSTVAETAGQYNAGESKAAKEGEAAEATLSPQAREIQQRYLAAQDAPPTATTGRKKGTSLGGEDGKKRRRGAVSYTHLTLPTSNSV